MNDNHQEHKHTYRIDKSLATGDWRLATDD